MQISEILFALPTKQIRFRDRVLDCFVNCFDGQIIIGGHVVCRARLESNRLAIERLGAQIAPHKK